MIDADREKLIAYYTLATTALRLRADNSAGYSSAEIKMFAICLEYQDVFIDLDGRQRLLSEAVFRIVINDLLEISQNTIGFKFIVLHSVPEAVRFYERNQFFILDKKYLMFQTDYTEGCIPMYMRLYKDDGEYRARTGYLGDD